MPHWLGNLLTWIYVPVFVLDIFLFSSSFVPATLHLILFVQLVKSYQPSKQDRDQVYLLILGFLQVLAASSLTIDASFLILFGIYLLVCLATLMVFEMKRAAVRASLQDLTAPKQRHTDTAQAIWVCLSKKERQPSDPWLGVDFSGEFARHRGSWYRPFLCNSAFRIGLLSSGRTILGPQWFLG